MKSGKKCGKVISLKYFNNNKKGTHKLTNSQTLIITPINIKLGSL